MRLLSRFLFLAVAAITLSGCFISSRDSYDNNSGYNTDNAGADCVRNRDQRFGKGDGVPCENKDINQIPDAVPKWEPKSRSGNPTSYVIQGKRYYVMQSAAGYSATGTASWYGQKFHGRKTSSGEVYDVYGMTAAHTSLPLPTYVRVTRLGSGPYAGKSIIVKVNDRGPFIANRLIDLSYAAAVKLGVVSSGTAPVRVEAITFASSNARPTTTTTASASNPVYTTPASHQTANAPTGHVVNDRDVTAANRNRDGLINRDSGHVLTPGFYLQFGAFSQGTSAQQLYTRLDAVNPLQTYIETRHNQQKTMHRVLAGKLQSRSDALAWRSYFTKLGYTDIVITQR